MRLLAELEQRWSGHGFAKRNIWENKNKARTFAELREQRRCSLAVRRVGLAWIERSEQRSRWLPFLDRGNSTVEVGIAKAF